MKLKIIPCLALVLGGALAALLTSCTKEKLLGRWEVDVEATLAQYDKVPAGWEREKLSDFKNNLRDELAGRAYAFSREHPEKPDWGEASFQGSVQIRLEGKWKNYGAWRTSTNQPGVYKVFVYAVNSGASYWPAGDIHIGTNVSQALWHQDPQDKPLVLHKE